MLAGLSLSLQQFSPLPLQLCSPKFQRPVFSIEFATQLNKVVHFFFERLDEVVSHEGYTVLEASLHYNARCFIGSMR